MEDAQATQDVEIDVVPPTLQTFDAVCEALDLDPEAVRDGTTLIIVQRGQEDAVLRLLCDEEEIPPTHRRQAAVMVVEVFFQEAFAAMERASKRAKRVADRLGVWGLMEGQSGEGPSLSRILARFDPDAYDRIYRQMPLDEALAYLMLRSVDHVSENIDDYLV